MNFDTKDEVKTEPTEMEIVVSHKVVQHKERQLEVSKYRAQTTAKSKLLTVTRAPSCTHTRYFLSF